MPDTREYSGLPTHNPVRYMLAMWRSMRDLSATDEVAIVEMGFARSRLGRRFARWDVVLDELRRDPTTARAMDQRTACAPIDLELLGMLPAGTLGRVFAEHCRVRGLNPNLAHVAPNNAVDWLIGHLAATHDIWHVVTGWGNDETGEVGLGAFYLAQLNAVFFAFLFTFILLNTVFRKPQTLRARMEAFVAGYEAGRVASPLIAVAWETLWALPLVDVRAQLGLGANRIVREGIGAAA